jgi:hypothetical protein
MTNHKSLYTQNALNMAWLKQAIWLCVLPLLSMPAQAVVYKCVVNGRTVYSDSRCAYSPDTIKADPNTNLVQGTPKNKSINQDSDKEKKCAQLLDRLSNTRVDLTAQTIGQSLTAKQTRKALIEEYELRCMSAVERESSARNRNDTETDQKMRVIEERMRQMQIKQQEMDNRQRGLGW